MADGVRLTYDVSEARAVIRGMRRDLRNARPMFEQIGRWLRTSTINNFERETSPRGARWKPSERAKREGGQTLTDSGRLRQSITWNATADCVEVGTNVHYAAIHQFGGKTRPRTIRARRVKALKIPGIGFRKSVRHPGSRIPARPFLGIGERDERQIVRIIARHLRVETAP